MVFSFIIFTLFVERKCIVYVSAQKNLSKDKVHIGIFLLKSKKNTLIFVRILRISLILEYLNHKNYKIKREYTRRKRWKKEKKKNTEIKNRQSKSMQIVFFCAQYLSSLSLYIGSNIRVIWRNGKKSVRCLYFWALKFAYLCRKNSIAKFCKRKKRKKRKNSHLNIKIYRCFMSNRL